MGPVAVRFRPPNGLLPSTDLPSFFSSSAEPKGLSLKSVLRRRREGGGVEALSSLTNLLPMVGEVIWFCKSSVDSLRLFPGRAVGEDVL